MKQLSFLFTFFMCSCVYSQEVKDYIKKYKDLAIEEMYRYKIPASITLAQGILESGSGFSKLALESNNHFGIKCHVDWKGPKIYHDDDENNECFRKYDNPAQSYRDHSIFLHERDRYAFLFKLRKHDYKGWAKGLQKAGYATSKTYAKKIIKLIKTYDLSQYDKKRLNKKAQKKIDLENNNSAPSIDIREVNYTQYVLAKEGQTYDDLAETYDMWLWELLKYNETEIDRVLTKGEKVYLKPKRNKALKAHHIFLEGESMYSVSQLYGIKLKQLYKKNRMQFGEEPYVGQKLSLIKRIN